MSDQPLTADEVGTVTALIATIRERDATKQKLTEQLAGARNELATARHDLAEARRATKPRRRI